MDVLISANGVLLAVAPPDALPLIAGYAYNNVSIWDRRFVNKNSDPIASFTAGEAIASFVRSCTGCR